MLSPRLRRTGRCRLRPSRHRSAGGPAGGWRRLRRRLGVPPRAPGSPFTRTAQTALYFGAWVLRRIARADFLPLLHGADHPAAGPGLRQELAMRVVQSWPLFCCHIRAALLAAGWPWPVTWPAPAALIPYIADQAAATEVAWLLLMLRRLGRDDRPWPPRLH